MINPSMPCTKLLSILKALVSCSKGTYLSKMQGGALDVHIEEEYKKIFILAKSHQSARKS